MTSLYKYTLDGRKINYEDWNAMVDAIETRPKTEAPDGCYPVTNLYVVIENGEPKLKVEYETNG